MNKESITNKEVSAEQIKDIAGKLWNLSRGHRAKNLQEVADIPGFKELAEEEESMSMAGVSKKEMDEYGRLDRKFAIIQNRSEDKYEELKEANPLAFKLFYKLAGLSDKSLKWNEIKPEDIDKLTDEVVAEGKEERGAQEKFSQYYELKHNAREALYAKRILTRGEETARIRGFESTDKMWNHDIEEYNKFRGDVEKNELEKLDKMDTSISMH